MGADLSGMDKLFASLRAKAVAVDAAVERAVNFSAHDLEAAAKKSFTSSHPRGTPTPSAPGSPPSVITGSMRRGITVLSGVRVGFGSYTAKVGPTVVYSRIQELGGATGRNHATHLPPRPYFTPSYEAFVAQDTLRRRIAAEITQALGT
jgi:phage gpG-like protein